MKRFILCISCLLICCLFLFPEVQAAIPDTGNWISHHLLTSDGLTVLAAGPAFAPLKWNIGQNNMGGYKGRLLFIPYDAPSTVPMIPAKPTTNEDLITASGSFTFPSGGTYTQPIYLYSTKGKVGYKAEIQGETDGKSFKQTLEFFFPRQYSGNACFQYTCQEHSGVLRLRRFRRPTIPDG
ncbi:hypothetical protein NXW84_06385 [Bacteroides fragilis]|nr:hypothetical protein NXW84_06385 [Bacteroides fragilis]